jgi:hypothetical protein
LDQSILAGSAAIAGAVASAVKANTIAVIFMMFS